jgi:hypothetical protein
MEKKNSSNKNLVNKIILASALVVGSMAINQGAKVDQIKELTSTYQGYTTDEGAQYLIFDDKLKEARTDFPDLAIKGNSDTLKIGKDYIIRYAIKNWENIFPNKIIELKYAKHSK